jgi:phospholipid/cholesterol/gamma-HCH transport system substrate-binding protein
MATPARLAGVGVFVAAGILLFAVGLFMIGDRQMAFARKFTVYTEFARITGLQPGAIVRVSGAKAGTIVDIQTPRTPSGKFRVHMEIAESLHPLVRTDSVAAIMTEGLVGGSYLGISTGSDQAPEVARDGTIAGHEPFEIADLLESMSDTVKKVNATIDEMKDDVEHAIESVGDTVDNANDLLNAVSDDVKTIASAGARVSDDFAEISDNVRNGKGTVGKLFHDDELYTHMSAVAKNAEEISNQTREVIARAREAIDTLQSKNGPVQGVTANLKETLDDARTAMSGFADNMEALKHNFLFRGFYNSRGYFDLSSISPAEYRSGVLTRDKKREGVRVWLGADRVFEAVPGTPGSVRLSDDGKARLESALAPYLDRIANAILIVEGYAQHGTEDERYLISRDRAALVEDYLVGRFHLAGDTTAIMPLGGDSAGSPGGVPWDGIALAVFLENKSK